MGDEFRIGIPVRELRERERERERSVTIGDAAKDAASF
jgi:hypothetical protein